MSNRNALLSSILLAAGILTVTGPALGQAAVTAQAVPEPEAEPVSRAAYHFARAKLLLTEGEFSAALEAFEEAVRLDPDDPYLRLEYAEALYDPNRPVPGMGVRQSQLDRAVEQVLKARDLAPENLDVLRAVGRLHLVMADFDPRAREVAVEAYEKVREKEPWDVQAMVSLGQLHFSRGDYAKAAEVFGEASNYTPNNRIVYTFLADALERSGQPREATGAMGHILALDPGDAETRIRLVETLGRLGEHGEALEVLQQAPEEVRTDPRLTYLEARELILADRPEEALAALDRLEGEGEEGELPGRLELYVTDLRARVLARLGRSDEALDEMTRLLDLDPGNPDVVRQVAARLAREGRTDEARSLLEEFIEDHRGQGGSDHQLGEAVRTARLNLATLLVGDEDWDRALEVLEPLLGAEDPDARLGGVVNTAEVLFQAGREAEALELLEEHAERGTAAESAEGGDGPPSAAVLAAKRAELLLRQGSETRARKLLRAQVGSGIVERALAVAGAFHREGIFEPTVPVLEQVAEAHPQSLDAWFVLGTALERSGRAEAAADAFRRALEIDPDDAQTLNYLGYMWADRGVELERALELVERAVELSPDNGAYLDSLGWAHYRLGNLDQAREHLERAARLAPGDSTIYEHLGDVYAALGDTVKAAEFYRRALQVADHDEENVSGVRRKLDELTVD